MAVHEIKQFTNTYLYVEGQTINKNFGDFNEHKLKDKHDFSNLHKPSLANITIHNSSLPP